MCLNVTRGNGLATRFFLCTFSYGLPVMWQGVIPADVILFLSKGFLLLILIQLLRTGGEGDRERDGNIGTSDPVTQNRLLCHEPRC